MSAAGFAGFREVVLADRGLQQEFLAIPDRPEFVALVARRAQDRGWDVTPGDVEEALTDSRRQWLERWI